MWPTSARSSAPRPSSSLSIRPPSRSSQRPGSSLSVRPTKLKHAPRLVTFAQQLVIVVDRISTGNPQFDAKVDETLKALDNTRNFGPSQDRIEIERRIHGYVPDDGFPLKTYQCQHEGWLGKPELICRMTGLMHWNIVMILSPFIYRRAKIAATWLRRVSLTHCHLYV